MQSVKQIHFIESARCFTDEAQIIGALRSGDIEQQALALDEALRVVNALISESVRTLADAETPFPIAAKIFKFGPLVIPMLEDLLRQSMSEDARNHTAALLVELGSTRGVPHLLSLLEHHDRNSVMAALVLGKAHVQEAAPFIRGVLDQGGCAADPYSAATLVEAFKRVDAIPDSLKDSLRQRWPREMRASLEELLQG